MIKITGPEDLVPYFGWAAIIKTTVGVCFELSGHLRRDKNFFCWYMIELPGIVSPIHFSWGHYQVDEVNKVITIVIQ